MSETEIETGKNHQLRAAIIQWNVFVLWVFFIFKFLKVFCYYDKFFQMVA